MAEFIWFLNANFRKDSLNINIYILKNLKKYYVENKKYRKFGVFLSFSPT